MNNKINAAILGCTGYTGIELIKILSNHPFVNIEYLGSQNNSGKNISNFYNFSNNLKKLPIIKDLKSLQFENYDIVFLALPHNVSQNIIKDNFNKTKIIDLSADFRLDDKIIYKQNYNVDHKCSEILKDFVYGLSDIYYDKIIDFNNIAVPGCYPTSVLIPLIPLVKNSLITTENIIIDSKSGYSGAGKNYKLDNLIKDNKFNFYNYNTNQHRHICEIKQELKKNTDNEIIISFNPHILPIFRGMMSTIYCDISNGYSKKQIYDFLKDHFNNSPFVKVLTENEPADFFSIINTNNCLIKLFNHNSNQRIIIVSMIDNLIKGASGQAVQNMNIIHKFDLKNALI
ncbi:MAG: N-acetyl-gamma-glutamyl-phosphate reductase [Alphaproteobacteria bacterium MarineAlpha5_Bin9]|nr:MAG: N-acetyl-gamma-glutamyl-phosphate reductase [Alphaproteobacteria bacterium MarineAlpha5_Bin9]|tara:strand:- start:6986 stop:8014 length:1029 start_codon:yes stop_codon:yes gene_type:complete